MNTIILPKVKLGENLGLINDFKSKIRKLNKENEIINFSQDDLISNTNKLFNEIANISLFEKQKIIFVDQANDKILEIVEEILQQNSISISMELLM